MIVWITFDVNFKLGIALGREVYCEEVHCGIAVGLANVQWKMHTSGGMMVSYNE